MEGLIDTLFVLEDNYGLRADRIDDKICLTLAPEISPTKSQLFTFLSFWEQKYKQYQSGQITKEEYDYIQYAYPRCNMVRGSEYGWEARSNMDLDDIYNKLMCRK